MSQKLILVPILLFFIHACSGSSAEIPEHVLELKNVKVYERDVTAKSFVEFTEAVNYDDEELIFGQIRRFEVDDGGSVYISEGNRGDETIYVFDEEGIYQTKIGRSGEGPGEFRSIFDISIIGNRLFVLDGSQLRLQAFNTDNYELEKVANLNPSDWDNSEDDEWIFIEGINAISDSTLLGHFNLLREGMGLMNYHVLDYNGSVESEQLISQNHQKHLPDPQSSSVSYDPFGGRGLSAISGNQEIYIVRSNELLFKVYSLNGEYQRSFYHPFNNRVMDRNEALNHYGEDSDRFKRALKSAGVPETWRAFEQFIMDDQDRIWISTITESDDIYQWWVMDKHGELLATFDWPREREIKKVKADRVYVFETDPETDLVKVVSYDTEWI